MSVFVVAASSINVPGGMVQVVQFDLCLLFRCQCVVVRLWCVVVVFIACQVVVPVHLEVLSKLLVKTMYVRGEKTNRIAQNQVENPKKKHRD